MIPRKKIRIGDLLVQHGIITEDQLQTALQHQKLAGGKLGKCLIQQGSISEDKLLEFLAQQLGISFIDLKTYRYDPEKMRLLSETYSRRFRAVLLSESPEGYLVGMADPTDLYAADELGKILKKNINLAVVRESDLLQTIDAVYRRTEEIRAIAGELGQEMGQSEVDLEALLPETRAEDAPVVRLLRTMFEDAVQIGASDIHVEPGERELRIRQRVDGLLQEEVIRENRVVRAVVSRLKLMSGLNISEKRLPQDGRFNIKVKDRNIDVRLSTMPNQFGESVVMRLLDQTKGLLKLEQIGLPEHMLQRFRRFIHSPQGMILVTGPTGSGKTTTLYGALNELNLPAVKIITVEDPVEYRLPRINQVQIHSRIDLTFAKVLRSALRQDPDIIMVGEMRDEETVGIGIRAAMTGHLVLSTLHTNDAVGTTLRLLDMGTPGYMVASSLRAVVSQRLVRRICPNCIHPDPLDVAKRNWVKSVLDEPVHSSTFQKGAGCSQCNNTGYQGRIGVFELLEIDERLAEALRSDDTTAFTRAAQQQKGFQPFMHHAMDYALQGITSLDEVLRISGQTEDFSWETEGELPEAEDHELTSVEAQL